jgi:hypothetical protein
LGGGGGGGGLVRVVAGLLQWLASAGGTLAAEGGGGRARPADCLDQLFVQAHRVHPILLAKVLQYHEHCVGSDESAKRIW